MVISFLFKTIRQMLFMALGFIIGIQIAFWLDPYPVLNHQSSQGLGYYDVLVYGDEMTSVCAAVWAKQTLGSRGKVVLVRNHLSVEPLGGLVTRGWLVFADLDKLIDWKEQPTNQCFRYVLSNGGIKGGSFDFNKTAKVLEKMLVDHNIKVLANSTITPYVFNNQIQFVKLSNGEIIKAHAYIDTTQNAELARLAGLDYYVGFESQDARLKQSTMAVSIIPKIKGLSLKDVAAIEKRIIKDRAKMAQLKAKIVKDNHPDLAKFFLKNFDLPMFRAEPDSYDVLSSALGVSYKVYRDKSFRLEGFFFDKGNISVLGDGSLIWLGFLFKYDSKKVLEIEKQDRRPTPEMITEMKYLEKWLSKLANKSVKVVLPKEVYVRHSLNIKEVIDPLTGQDIIKGGTPKEKSIGSFSYEFDARGGISGFVGTLPPLPVFNFGIENAMAKPINNLAIVGRSTGLVGLAPTVGRLLTFGVYQAQGIGVAAGLAVRQGVSLNEVRSREVRLELEKLTKLKTKLYGRDTSNGKNYAVFK